MHKCSSCGLLTRAWFKCPKARNWALTIPNAPLKPATWHTPGGRDMELSLQGFFSGPEQIILQMF